MPCLPSGPFRVLTHLKYASIPRGIGAYSDAGPLSGNVPPIVIVVLVTPGAAVEPARLSTRANAPGMHTASAVSTAASAISALFTCLPPPSKCPCAPYRTPPQGIVGVRETPVKGAGRRAPRSAVPTGAADRRRSEEHTSELQ